MRTSSLTACCCIAILGLRRWCGNSRGSTLTSHSEGAITFKNARKNLEALAAVPRDRLLLETDSPYMTPVPYRGKTNFPRYVSLVADKAAEVLSVSREEVEELTLRNTKRLFFKLK